MPENETKCPFCGSTDYYIDNSDKEFREDIIDAIEKGSGSSTVRCTCNDCGGLYTVTVSIGEPEIEKFEEPEKAVKVIQKVELVAPTGVTVG